MHAEDGRICFPEAAPAIQHCIAGRFAQFWRDNGGLDVFGYPIAEAQPEVNDETGQTYLTQYFERQRFEHHPEYTAPYDVQLSRLGDAYLLHTGRNWRHMPQADPGAHHYMPATGHAIASEFYAHYRSFGLSLGDAGVSDRESRALFGYPISEPMMERVGNRQLLVQYFERTRLEYHPDNPAAHRVLQGRLGSELKPGHDEYHHSNPSHPENPDPHHSNPNPGHSNDDNHHTHH
ncbi:MAG: hypothetical protein MI924_02555 [Chloroflexales bacterium]|nr:hypothetical protein [Chloroflexales bacterium]